MVAGGWRTERRPELGHHEYNGAESYARSADARTI